MPVWLPAEGEYAGFGRRSNAKAIAAGLTFRPLADTARATLDFHESRAADGEVEVLAAWKARKA